MPHGRSTIEFSTREASSTIHSPHLLPCSALQATNTGFHLSGSTGNFTESDVRVLPTAEYLRANDLITHGEGPNDHVPDPCQTFESARFPSDLLNEVRRMVAAAAVENPQAAFTLLLLLVDSACM
jgi:hypothetical protein